MTGKKGRLEEIFSKAIYADDPRLYTISYRDFESVVQLPLLEFLKLSENFELIPANRIVVVSKEGEVIYRKFSEIKSI
jgi:uncharacterized protein (UPF0248 family)